MSEGDDGASEPPGSPKKPVLPRPGTPARAKGPPPVPAAKGTAPLAPKANPFLERESIRDLDAGWLSPEESAEPVLAKPAPEAPPEPTPIPQVAEPPAPPAPQAPTAVAAPPPAPVAIARVEATEQAKLSLREPKRSRVKVIAFVLFAGIALVVGGLAYQRRGAPKVPPTAPQSSADTIASAAPPKAIVEAVPPPTSTAEAPPSASAPKKPAAAAGAAGGGAPVAALSADPSKTGIVDTSALPAGRKIVVDGRLVGTSPHRVVVRCGSHRFQIGDLPTETIDLPCGGELTFSD